MTRFVAFVWKIGLGGSKVEGVNKHSIFQISHRAVVILFVIAWSNLAFCGEINYAAKNGDLETVKALLKANPDLVSSKGQYGDSPLHLAATAGHKDVAVLLLANKADVNAKNNAGGTPLHSASGYGHEEIAALLLANKADVNAKDMFGSTPLHGAAANGFVEVVKLLLANKAEVNAKAGDGQTPLHGATMYGRTEVAELLLTNGADVNAKAQVMARRLCTLRCCLVIRMKKLWWHCYWPTRQM